MSRAALCLVLAACGNSGSGPSSQQQQPPPQTPADAGIDGITAIGSYDPSSGRHLDDDVPRTPRKPPPKRDAKTISILLKSTPSKAHASVDGEGIGDTPTMWTGLADGQLHRFTFVKDDYALAEYVFIPVTDGVVHSKLVKIADDRVDAGVPANGSSTTYTPDAAVAPPPSPPPPPPIDAATLVHRPDAAEALAPDAGAPSQPPTGGAGPAP